MPDFPFHFQDTSDYCGPTCLQMALENEGIPIGEMRQSALMSDINTGSLASRGAFVSPPDGVMNAANQRLRGKGISLRYRIFEPSAPRGSRRDQEMTDEILDGLTGSNAPVFTLVQSGGHWVLIFLSRLRRGIRYFYVRWPVFPHPGRVSLQHNNGCSLCPASSTTVLAAEELFDTLLPIFDRANGHWNGRTLLLLPVMQNDAAPHPPAPPVDGGAAPAGNSPGPVLGGASGGPPPNPEEGTQAACPTEEPGGKNPSGAAAAAPRPGGADTAVVSADEEKELRELFQDELRDLDELFEVHKGRLATATVGPPLCVYHLARPGSYYYLVPVFSGEDRPFLLAMVSPCRRRLLRIETVDEKEGQTTNSFWVYVLLVDEDLTRLLSKSVKTATDGEFRLTGRLFWQPCDQSRSPFQPFHELSGPGGEPAWLDVFGHIHHELTDNRNAPGHE